MGLRTLCSVCDLGQLTQPLWDSIFSTRKMKEVISSSQGSWEDQLEFLLWKVSGLVSVPMRLIPAWFLLYSGLYVTYADGLCSTAGIQKHSPACGTGRNQLSVDQTLPSPLYPQGSLSSTMEHYP